MDITSILLGKNKAEGLRGHLRQAECLSRKFLPTRKMVRAEHAHWQSWVTGKSLGLEVKILGSYRYYEPG